MGVWPATAAELDAVMDLLDAAREWQRRRGVGVWSAFDRAAVAAEISLGAVQVAKAQDVVQGAATLLESDALIWDADGCKALYVHRLVSSRQAAGRGAGALLIRYARAIAGWRCKTCLRLETWSENRAMRDYYERQGFRHVADRSFPADSPAPPDYRGTTKSFYQLDL